MAKLTELLLILVNKAPYNSEAERDETLDLLREVADELGDADDVPPPPGAMNAPAPAPDVDPGVVAEPVPADEQPEPPTSPEVTGASPEEANAFSGEPSDPT